MVQIDFLGASGTVTGSSYLLTGDHKEKILIDCGMFQGVEGEDTLNRDSFSFSPQELSAIFLTHAHLDHCGRLPLLTKAGFTGPIYMTEATKKISEISLLDAAAIQEEEAKKTPVMYSKEDVASMLQQVKTVNYDQQFTIGEYAITFQNAGHILGSGSIEIVDNSQTIVFSGDLGNSPERLIQPLEYIQKADTVVMESTYGDKKHPTQDALAILEKEIHEITASGGVLLIPAFSIQRTQEILHCLSHLLKDGKIQKDIPVFLDSPMAIEVTEVFKQMPQLYSKELSQDEHPFDFPNLVDTRKVQESKDILKAYAPKIIIAGSGMMSGGRILHHLINYLPIPTTRLLIVGYQAVRTLGRELEEGAKHVRIYNEEVAVKATITKLEAFSSHADMPALITWLKHIQGVENVFLTHGEDEPRQTLKIAIEKELHIQRVFTPQKGETHEIN